MPSRYTDPFHRADDRTGLIFLIVLAILIPGFFGIKALQHYQAEIEDEKSIQQLRQQFERERAQQSTARGSEASNTVMEPSYGGSGEQRSPSGLAAIAQPAPPVSAMEHMRRAQGIYDSINANARARQQPAVAPLESWERYLASQEGICNIHQRGTIVYRRCRADVSERLRHQCQQARWTSEQHTNSLAPDSYRDVCYAADHFMALD